METRGDIGISAINKAVSTPGLMGGWQGVGVTAITEVAASPIVMRGCRGEGVRVAITSNLF